MLFAVKMYERTFVIVYELNYSTYCVEIPMSYKNIARKYIIRNNSETSLCMVHLPFPSISFLYFGGNPKIASTIK